MKLYSKLRWPQVHSYGLAFIGLCLMASAQPLAASAQNNSLEVLGRLQPYQYATGKAGYAIYDRDHQLLHYVAPTADVNLDPFVGGDVLLMGYEQRRTGDSPSLIRATSIEMVAQADAASTSPAPQGAEPIDLPLNLADDTIILDDVGIGPYMPGSMIPRGQWLADRMWIRAEYLYWQTSGMRIPPLVTTSPENTPISQAGVLGQPGTRVLLGNQQLFDDWQNGYRASLGFWVLPNQQLGIEGEYFELYEDSARFRYSSDGRGSPILARPFFNMNPRDATGALAPPAREDAELVSFPDVLSGSVTVRANTELRSAGIRFLWKACCTQSAGCQQCCGEASGAAVNFLLGYRYLRLKDGLTIQEDLTSLETANPGSFLITDQFRTTNEFQGVDVGVQWQRQRNRLTLELLSKLALGYNRQQARIQGNTLITPIPGGPGTNFTGGLLAQRTNLGNYSRDEFAVIPELGARASLRVTDRLSLSIGYTLIYFSNVIRPGDQISLNVNPDLLPPEAVPFVGAERPGFRFVQTDYWAHGLNAGIDFRF